MDIAMETLFPRMVGGDESLFFHRYWRARTLFVESALPELRSFYNIDNFIHDYRQLDNHKATLLISVDANRNRRMLRPGSAAEIEEALTHNSSVVLQALLLRRDLATLPPQWAWFVALYDSLCKYLLPTFPSDTQPYEPVAAVDIFCTQGESSTGGHYDTGDVFYFVLEGEKEWTVELCPDLQSGFNSSISSVSRGIDRLPLKDSITLQIRPGDCLYVPPYTYHRVTSTGRSLAVSVGLPAFTEATVLLHKAILVMKDRPCYEPLPSFPVSQDTLREQAQEQTNARLVRSLLNWFPCLKGYVHPIGTP